MLKIVKIVELYHPYKRNILYLYHNYLMIRIMEDDNIDAYSVEIDPDVLCQDYDIACQQTQNEYYNNDDTNIQFE